MAAIHVAMIQGRTTVNSFTAEVVDIREESRTANRVRWQLLLDRSEFAEGQRGTIEATARSGVNLTLSVLDTLRDNHGELWHIVEKPLAAGTPVTCVVQG